MQTLKNHTKKSVARGNESVLSVSNFSNGFKYIEIPPELINDDKIKITEERTRLMISSYLKKVDFTNHILRFRKIRGENKMGYYSFNNKEIVLDQRKPGHAMIHEIGHLIDFQFGLISSGLEFKKVMDTYVYEVKYCVKKYKLKIKKEKYYFDAKEVFARCFVIYIEFCKGCSVVSSNDFSDEIYAEIYENCGFQIGKKVEDLPEYFDEYVTDNDSLIHMICDFFDHLLN